MRKWTVATAIALAGLGALSSLPASADHRHHGVVHARPYVSFGYNYGYGYPFGYGFGYYRPWYDPFWGPRVGVGVRIDPYRSRRGRTEESASRQQRALKMYVYPAAGQSEAQTSEDKYQCHVWAADQSGYDPTNGAGDRDDAESYTRAFTACMEGRNYVVK
jgi:hypothetical protein